MTDRPARRLLGALLWCAACTAQPDRNVPYQRASLDSAAVYPFGVPDSTNYIPATHLSILGVTIGTSQDVVRREIGPPTDSVLATPPDERDSVFTWRYPGIEVSFARHRVYDLQCLAPRCITHDGVRLGAPRADVLRAYGPGFRGYYRSNDVLVYYSHPRDCVMVFVFTRARVTRMYVQCALPPHEPV